VAENCLLRSLLKRTRSNNVKALVEVEAREHKTMLSSDSQETKAAGKVICDIVNDSVTKCDRRGSAT
jgi:hypothetical protein